MFKAIASLLLLAGCSAAPNLHAGHARWMAHNLSYGVLSTSSVQFPGVAFGNPQSFVDGTLDNATGSLYMYVSSMDASMIDIAKRPQVSFTLSQEMIDDYCAKTDLDPEDPLCIRVVLVGTIKNVSASTAVWAKKALFDRHPGMKQWPADHSFYVVTLELNDVWVIDAFGGASTIPAAEYYASAPIAPAPRNVTTPLPSPGSAPLFLEHAKTARWMAHKLGYGVLSTTSAREPYTGDFQGVAFGNPQSFADGTTDQSTGHLYFYMTTMDASGTDLETSKKASFALSEQMLSSHCTKKSVDPEDPRCARLVFTGDVRNCTSTEIPAAKTALFARHPEMTEWPSDHSFQFYTMDIENIWLIDMFGGASSVTTRDYYKTKP